MKNLLTFAVRQDLSRQLKLRPGADSQAVEE